MNHNVNPIGPIKGPQENERLHKNRAAQKSDVSFKDTLGKFMNDVNSMQVKADESIKKMAAGEINDVHQVMTSVQEAKVAFNMMMEIRNKVMDAYKEVMRMQL